ncbi:MAG: CPBP family intramembrane metalloprotease [Anaerolineae bacterium]|nr:CPBP family intramembrane metalloprotease [Anaerolineae bacterium]
MSIQESDISHKQLPRTPSLWIVNTFLLLGLFFIIVVGRYSDALPQFAVSILGEIFLALVVIALVFFERLPIRETLRLRWVGWKPPALSIILALSVWFIGATISIILALLLGYTPPTSPESIPQTFGGTVLLLIATMVAAPICEEIMFRGYVQRAYDRWGAWAGIVVCSAIFTLYHLRFLGLLGLAPVALMLGVVAWRSESLLPGMAMHAAYNGMASIVIIVNAFFPFTTVLATTGGLICLSAVMIPLSLVAIWLFWQYTSVPVMPVPSHLAGWRRWIWVLPLLVILGIYGYAAFREVLLGRFPEVLAVESLELQPPSAWEEGAHTWNYEIRTTFDEVVGDAACTLTPAEAVLQLNCRMQHRPFTDQLPFLTPALSTDDENEGRFWNQDLSWTRDDLQVITLERMQGSQEDPSVFWHLTGSSAELTVTHEDTVQKTDLTSATLLQDEWPWRLSALPFKIAYGSKTTLVRADGAGQIQTEEVYVGVTGSESVWTPIGSFVTWKVVLSYATAGEETELAAWYAVEAPHILVQYDDGVVRYLLSSVK